MRPRPFSARVPIRYNIASMMPQATLHPSAPISISRTSSRPASATLREPVNVRTMISPKRTSGDAIDRVQDPLGHATLGGNMYSVMAKIA